jgi:hypothetical protein
MVNYRIGIDGDVDKSGFAVIRIEPFKKPQIIQLTTLDLFDLCENLRALNEVYKEATKVEFMVFIEAGWLNNSVNHHTSQNKFVAGKIGSSVGANLEIGKQIEKFCKKYNIQYRLYKPTTTKWDAKKFKMITGYEQRTNSEQRDAVRAAWL